MDSNRSEILAQLASGQITADQAAEQLRGTAAGAAADAAPNPPEPPRPAAAQTTPEAPAAAGNRWLRVRVSDMASGRQRVSVNLPLSWLAIGLRIGARFSPEVAELDPDDILAAIQAGNVGQVVDVEDLDDGQRVQVFIE
jgi:hypothetical protein